MTCQQCDSRRPQLPCERPLPRSSALSSSPPSSSSRPLPGSRSSSSATRTACRLRSHAFHFYLTAVLLQLIVFPLLFAHPAPSLALCHGQQYGTRYVYSYRTSMLLNNNDHMGKEPVGFGHRAEVTVENVWQDEVSYILRVAFAGAPAAGHFVTRQGEARPGPGGDDSSKSRSDPTGQADYPIYAHIVDEKESQRVKAYYVHTRDPVTRTNIKKAVLNHLQTKKSGESDNVDWQRSGQEIVKTFDGGFGGQDASVLAPHVIDQWSTVSRVGRDHSMVVEVNGWQNVTFLSRVYSTAHSKLHSTFELKLVKEEKTAEVVQEKSVEAALVPLGENYIEVTSHFQRETKVCHDCKTLLGLTRDMADAMGDRNMASISMAVTYLKLLERVRSGGPGTSKDDIESVLAAYYKKKKMDIVDTLLDVLAGARTENSIAAALKYLELPSNDDLDQSERFLTSLGASCMTLAQMEPKTVEASQLKHAVEQLLAAAKADLWANEKLRRSTLTTLGTLLRAYNHGTGAARDDDLNKAVIKHMTASLRACKGATECQVALLHALGNAGNLRLSYNTLEKFALDLKAKRESIAAMKAIKECIAATQPTNVDEKTAKKIRLMALKVVYDAKQESTSRIIGTEIIARYLDDDYLAHQLLRDVATFGNHEMATLMWVRALKDAPVARKATWLHHSTMFNGTSDAFTRTMGGTSSMNATYGIAMELLNQGKLLKESSFDVELAGAKGRAQHILSVGLFARGLQGFAGDEDSSEDQEQESMMAGMALRILGFQLRPYVFFTGKGELLGHVWSGTGSEPMTAFQGNLLVSDYDECRPLVNGFVVEQQLRGVLSVDLSGEVTISMWNRNANSVVRTKAALLIQGSQSILTSDLTTSAAQRFGFGGQTAIDFKTDIEFYEAPFKMCMQIVQPDFVVRHNTRKYEQVAGNDVHRRIHRRNYSIPAKSFALHRDNNEMCSILMPGSGQ